MIKKIVSFWMNGSLVLQIIVGLLLGIALAVVWPQGAKATELLGSFFVGALKAVAPVLVFILVTAAITRYQANTEVSLKPILVLYALGTFLAALAAVAASFLFPTSLTLISQEISQTPPSNIVEVLKNLLLKMVDNPLNALLNANYISILTWSGLLGMTFQQGSESTKNFINDLANSITQIVQWVIRLAPIGIFGLVASNIAMTGFAESLAYGRLLLVLVGTMLFVALIMNPLLVFWKLRQNPYPLVFTCLLESGITAFFTRSSAANIPVNLSLAKKLELKEETYSISIPLGATINMAGAAVTITVLTLAAVYTLDIPVDFLTAILLSLLAAISAIGASGVPGGSLLLIPMACALFGIGDDLATKVVGVGFIIAVVQDSFETALNSSTDILFTAAADLARRNKV